MKVIVVSVSVALICMFADARAASGQVAAGQKAHAPGNNKTRFYFRGGVIHIKPLESGGELVLDDIDGPATLAVSNGPVQGSGSDVASATLPGIIIGYVTPWLDGRLSIEAVLGTPFEIEFRATGTLANESLAPEAVGLPTGVPALGPEIGTTKAAPPTVTAVYRFARTIGPVQPYAGAGVSVLLTYGGKVTNPTLTEVGDPDFSIPPAPGFVIQGGLEAPVWRSMWAAIDVKFIAGMLARARVTDIVVRSPRLPLFEQVEVGTAKMNVWINPVVVQLSVGMNL